MEHDTSTNHPSHDTVIVSETDAPAEITSEQVDQDITNGTRIKGRLVTVTVDTKPHTVRKGRYIVSDFKRLVGVDPSYQLDQVVNGQFVKLEDIEKVSIPRARRSSSATSAAVPLRSRYGDDDRDHRGRSC